MRKWAYILSLGCLLPLFSMPPAAVGAAGAQLLPSLGPMLETVSPAVVNISGRGMVALRENPLFQDPFFRRFFDVPEMPSQREVQSAGSGVIIDADNGYIVTNAHVVEKADEILVVLNDRRELEAEVVGTDPEADIAVLRVEADGLTELPFSDDAVPVGVGDFVVAIGNPFGLGQTATLGIVSAVGRSGLGIEGYEDFIQTDASINPGNSGGALVDMRGELVGINTAILSRTGGNIGIGFAIPARMARQLADQLIAYGEVRRGQLGVTIQDLTPDIARAMGLDRAAAGAVVSQVMPDTPAEESGLRAGDIIVAVNGQPIRSSAELRNTVGLMQPGTEVEIGLLRDGERRTVTATLAGRDSDESAAGARGSEDLEKSRLAGVRLSPLPPGHPLSGEIESGVIVTAIAPGSDAARAGLERGDVIVSVNREPVDSPEDVRAAIRNTDADVPVLLNVRRGEGALFIPVG